MPGPLADRLEALEDRDVLGGVRRLACRSSARAGVGWPSWWPCADRAWPRDGRLAVRWTRRRAGLRRAQRADLGGCDSGWGKARAEPGSDAQNRRSEARNDTAHCTRRSVSSRVCGARGAASRRRRRRRTRTLAHDVAADDRRDAARSTSAPGIAARSPTARRRPRSSARRRGASAAARARRPSSPDDLGPALGEGADRRRVGEPELGAPTSASASPHRRRDRRRAPRRRRRRARASARTGHAASTPAVGDAQPRAGCDAGGERARGRHAGSARRQAARDQSAGARRSSSSLNTSSRSSTGSLARRSSATTRCPARRSASASVRCSPCDACVRLSRPSTWRRHSSRCGPTSVSPGRSRWRRRAASAARSSSGDRVGSGGSRPRPTPPRTRAPIAGASPAQARGTRRRRRARAARRGRSRPRTSSAPAVHELLVEHVEGRARVVAADAALEQRVALPQHPLVVGARRVVARRDRDEQVVEVRRAGPAGPPFTSCEVVGREDRDAQQPEQVARARRAGAG